MLLYCLPNNEFESREKRLVFDLDNPTRIPAGKVPTLVRAANNKTKSLKASSDAADAANRKGGKLGGGLDKMGVSKKEMPKAFVKSKTGGLREIDSSHKSYDEAVRQGKRLVSANKKSNGYSHKDNYDHYIGPDGYQYTYIRDNDTDRIWRSPKKVPKSQYQEAQKEREGAEKPYFVWKTDKAGKEIPGTRRELKGKALAEHKAREKKRKEDEAAKHEAAMAALNDLDF